MTVYHQISPQSSERRRERQMTQYSSCAISCVSRAVGAILVPLAPPKSSYAKQQNLSAAEPLSEERDPATQGGYLSFR